MKSVQVTCQKQSVEHNFQPGDGMATNSIIFETTERLPETHAKKTKTPLLKTERHTLLQFANAGRVECLGFSPVKQGKPARIPTLLSCMRLHLRVVLYCRYFLLTFPREVAVDEQKPQPS